MKKTPSNLVRVGALSVLCGAGLVACGGGGDGGGDAPPEARGTVALTTTNRDTAARATAISVISLGASTAIPFAADGDAVALQARAPAASGAARIGIASWLPERVLDTLRQAAAAPVQSAAVASMRPLAVVVVPPEPCAVSGTVAVTFDDRDNNDLLSVGDVWTFVFSECQDDAADVLDGTATATFTSVQTTTLPSFTARLGLVDLSDDATDGSRRINLNGTVVLDYAQSSASTERLKLTAEGDVVVAVQTNLPYGDTVTLRSGFYQDASYDTGTGVTTATMLGSVRSQALGGTVVASTVTPIVVADSDDYPTSGAVRALGSTGQVRLTAVSASQVRIELDANDNGSFESSDTVSWDDLF